MLKVLLSIYVLLHPLRLFKIVWMIWNEVWSSQFYFIFAIKTILILFLYIIVSLRDSWHNYWHSYRYKRLKQHHLKQKPKTWLLSAIQWAHQINTAPQWFFFVKMAVSESTWPVLNTLVFGCLQSSSLPGQWPTLVYSFVCWYFISRN